MQIPLYTSGETPADIFREKYGDIFPLIGKEPNFTNVTGNLFANKLITPGEIGRIKTQHNLDDNKRGDALAMNLFEKIDVDDNDKSAQCLLKICDVFESKKVDNEELKKLGSGMREKLLSTTATSQVPTDAISSAPPQPSEPTTTQTNPNELNVGDVEKVLNALNKAMFGPTKWRSLGLSLGLIAPTLDTIGKTNGDSEDYLEKTIQKWLQRKDQVKGTTWKILKEAVASTGDNAAAGKIP
ncbi:PREDICTED: uncharacterized protein LOC109582578 isoform X2 [Amphimedon queenslandica]|uniref:Death domain-containing protein n=1 Tax=Amphimedon queenslandica TaxID=400682 RepID=A0AAN0J867_AMPQE|nr:PREDICTED: uncharacterized protein LOC109582578 isoform X2 [Amphimedon queenslandica]|eukprot:XP_019852898.1 PREDICTED: uncharacterized protein LOC109582578 isoform X2 [Amphimedon queenslandica]